MRSKRKQKYSRLQKLAAMLFFAGVYLLGAATMVGGVLVIYAGALMIIGLAFIWAAEE